MVLLILLVLALFVIQTFLPNRWREKPAASGSSRVADMLGPRDDWQPLTGVGGRAQRALANMQEALPVFLTLALLNLILGTGNLATTGATVFLVARTLYVPAYLSGLVGVRTLIWMASLVGLILMLIPILTRT